MIVVTGAAGRLGKRVAQRLTDEGFQFSTERPSIMGTGAYLIKSL